MGCEYIFEEFLESKKKMNLQLKHLVGRGAFWLSYM
jgi:hypothetical protein